MEVHQHPHLDRNKKWHHYFWEFFMLFLAVSLGFMVENRREHYIEHKRVRDYARLMVADLKEDSDQLNLLIDRYQIGAAGIDTFVRIIDQEDPHRVAGGKLYWYGLWGGFLHPFVTQDATFQQMKNSGSLRYISNQELSHKIALYDEQVRKIESMMQFDRAMYTEARKTRGLIFHVGYLKKASEMALDMYISLSGITPFNPSRLDTFLSANPPLLTYDKVVLNQYAELCRSRSLQPLGANLKVLLLIGKEIIQDLKKEFRLE